MPQVTTFLWGVFPYIALVVMVTGTLYRYNSGQLTWTSKSSELFEKRLLISGSVLFHYGIIGVFGGHVLGLLVPLEWYTAIGVSPEMYHMVAMVAGGFFGLMTFAGISILIYRRLACRRVRLHTDFSDYVTDGLLWLVILLGLAMTLGYNLAYGPYEYRATIGPWLRSVLALHPDVALMASVPILFQVHIGLALLLFAVSPFTRLVHLYSAPLAYITRAPLQYRARYGYRGAVSVPPVKPAPRASVLPVEPTPRGERPELTHPISMTARSSEAALAELDELEAGSPGRQR